jgi:alpha-L-rhamnosidase
MRVEYASAPLAIGTRIPRFSWEVPLEGRGRRQTAYQVRVATAESFLSSGMPNVWDSGKVLSSQSINVEYAGEPLRSNMDYFWDVQVWDEDGVPAGFCRPAYFGTGLFDRSDWQAEWIGMGPESEPSLEPYAIRQRDASKGLKLSPDDMQKLPDDLKDYRPDGRAPLLRKTFNIAKPVQRARAYICGLGLFEFHMNGNKVGDDVLSTPRTDFRKRVTYFTYDVTDQLLPGDNAVGIMLGNGWFNGQKKYWHWQAPWYGEPRALVQIEMTYTDGSTDRVISDASWLGSWSPITFNCIYDGEDYDARLAQDGWDVAGFDPKGWNSVNKVSAPGGQLVALACEPNKVMKQVEPVGLSEPMPGIYVYDMGTVMTGWVKLWMPIGKAGDVVTLRYAECRHADGMIDPSSGGEARQADRYTMKGGDNESYAPRFTYHGFRYVEVTGLSRAPKLTDMTASFVYSGVVQSGTFECGHSLINKIHACTLQSQRCNLQMGVPTDDTQREERLGWCGDAWSYAEESIFNFDMARFWRKWIADCCDQQDEESGLVGYICPLPGWGEDLVWSCAFVLIPWWLYLHYGDRRILEQTYPYLKKYIKYLEKTGKCELPDLSNHAASDYLFPETPLASRYSTPDNHGYLQHSLFGDHLATHEGGSGMAKDQPRAMATAFYHLDVGIMARIADTLGYGSDADAYRALADKIRVAFNERFYDGGANVYGIGAQSVQALALCFDLVPDTLRGKLQGYLNSSVNYRQQRITSGYAGTKWVVKAIAESDRDDIVWSRAIATEYPSWGYMLHDDKTTITENWMGKASQCHTTLGAAIDEWFYWGLVGIRPDESAPGYGHILIKPCFPADLPWARASINTPRGMIESAWERTEGLVALRVTIPPNSTATVVLPVKDPGAVTESEVALDLAEGVSAVRVVDDQVRVEIVSGIYSFRFTM